MDLVKLRQEARAKVLENRYDVKVQKFAKEVFATTTLSQDRAQSFDHACLKSVRDSGLLGIELSRYLPDSVRRALAPEEGAFADTVTAIRMISQVDPAVAVLVHVHNALAVRCIMQFGTDAQKTQWLPALAQNMVGAFAATEPEAGSDLSQMTTRVRIEDGNIILNGEKHWITNASEAGLFVVFASTQTGGTVAVLVPADAPGVVVGPRINKMSMRASSTCSVTFRDVTLNEDAMLGGVNSGMDIAIYGLVCGRIGIAAQMLGLAEGALQRAVSYANAREAFGSKIVDFQGVNFPLAQIKAEITSVDLTIKEALRVLETSKSHMKAMDLANTAKLLASQLAERSASVAVETLGGNGVAESHEVEKFYRDAKVGRIYEGTVNILLRSLSHSLFEDAS